MGNLSANWSKHEFECKGCECRTAFHISLGQIKLLQKLREQIGETLICTSGLRCKLKNDRTPGASSNSYHLLRGTVLYAADITFLDPALRTPKNILKLYVLADQLKAKAIGLYGGSCPRLHLDNRPTTRPARWIDRTWSWPE